MSIKFLSLARLFVFSYIVFTNTYITDLHAEIFTPPNTPVDLILQSKEQDPYGKERFINLTSFWSESKEIMNGFLNLYNPEVIKMNSGNPNHYRIYLFGWPYDFCNKDLPGCDAIFMLESDNLNLWNLNQPIIDNIPPAFNSSLSVTLNAGNDYWNQWHIGDPSILKVNDGYVMAYSAVGFDADGINAHADLSISANYKDDKDGFYYTIGGASSENGVNWKTSELPIVSTILEYGEKDPVYNGIYHRPSIIYDVDRFKMWFDYYNSTPLNKSVALPEYHFSMGYAELVGTPTVKTFNSTNWVIRQAYYSPAIPNWPNPEVIKLPLGYLSFADPNGHQGGQWYARKTSMAYSTDGVNWQILGYIEHSPQCGGNHVPEAFVDENILYLFSACIINWHYSSIHARTISLQDLEKLIQK